MLRRLPVLIFSLFFVPLAFAQEEITLEPSKDNTLYESNSGALSNGAGDHLFVGTTAQGDVRRTLLAFDLEGALPDGAQVQSVTLDLNMSKTIAGATDVSVHRVSADWGEGDSDAPGEEGAGTEPASGDATWVHRFYDTDTWTEAGGDFVADASATFSVAGNGGYSASSDGMADDVRAWLDDPSSNFGWILIGNESASTTAKRFDSRENAASANRPMLTITYTTSNTASERTDLPTTLRLTGNFPNPFAEATTIRYEVERAQEVSLTLYDVLGREVRALVRGYRPAGAHEVAVSAQGLSAGTYLYCFDGAGSCGRTTLIP